MGKNRPKNGTKKRKKRAKNGKKRGRPLIIRFKRVILDFADAHFEGDTPQLGHGAVRPAWSGFPQNAGTGFNGSGSNR